MTSPVRRRDIEGFRGVACTTVMAYHITLAIRGGALDAVPSGGFLGVVMFFPLSGFLITSVLLGEHERTGRISLRGFYHRRVRRLAPVFMAYLAGHLAWVLIAHPHFLHYEMESFGWVGGQLANEGMQRYHVAPAMEITWSLAVEEQFYLLWPLILLVALRFGATRRQLRIGTIALTVGLVAYRSWWYHEHQGFVGLFTSYHSFTTRITELLVGCWLALREPGRPGPPTWLRSIALAAMVYIVCVGTFVDTFFYEGGLTLFAILAVIVIAPGADGREQGKAWWGARLLGTPLLVMLGRASYSLYLWQALISAIVLEHTDGWNLALRGVACAVASVTVAIFSYGLIEKPIMDRRSGRSPGPEPVLKEAAIVAASVVAVMIVAAIARPGQGFPLLVGAWVGLVMGVQLALGAVRPGTPRSRRAVGPAEPGGEAVDPADVVAEPRDLGKPRRVRAVVEP